VAVQQEEEAMVALAQADIVSTTKGSLSRHSFSVHKGWLANMAWGG
jgi:hypothetical protein